MFRGQHGSGGVPHRWWVPVATFPNPGGRRTTARLDLQLVSSPRIDGSRYTSAAPGRCVSVPGVDHLLHERDMAKTGVRVAITLACTECKRRNYQTMKSKRNTPDRVEFKKYCRWCGTHTPHRETR